MTPAQLKTWRCSECGGKRVAKSNPPVCKSCGIRHDPKAFDEPANLGDIERDRRIRVEREMARFKGTR